MGYDCSILGNQEVQKERMMIRSVLATALSTLLLSFLLPYPSLAEEKRAGTVHKGFPV